MPRYSDRWGLSILGAGDSLQSDGFKFTDADIRLIDRILTWAAETHRHSGETGADRTPVAALSLLVETTGGSIASGNRLYYRYTVVDADGNESAGSPIQPVDTPSSITAPQAPAPSYIVGSGSLEPGGYSYACSAYKTATTVETKALNSTVIKIPGTNPSNSVSMILPDLPTGATGLNIYRKAPSGMYYLYITSIAAPVTGQVWVDTGAITPTYDRTLPAVNRTSNDNSVVISYPGATPSIPDGWSWNIYRSDNPNDWSRSYLATIGPQGVPLSTPVTYTDLGSATQTGGPPTLAQLINAPPKITLTDAAEIQGSPPPGLLVAPYVVSFCWADTVLAHEGSFTWVCDFEQADVIYCRAYLGVGSTPAADDVIVDVDLWRSGDATPAWVSMFGDGPSRPTVPVGETIGDPAIPALRHLVAGDMLCVDIDQAGGGATPTDTDLTVNILLYVQDGSDTTSYTWATE